MSVPGEYQAAIRRIVKLETEAAGFRRQVVELRQELAEARRLVEGLAERCAGQSELLAQRALKSGGPP